MTPAKNESAPLKRAVSAPISLAIVKNVKVIESHRGRKSANAETWTSIDSFIGKNLDALLSDQSSAIPLPESMQRADVVGEKKREAAARAMTTQARKRLLEREGIGYVVRLESESLRFMLIVRRIIVGVNA